MGLNLDSKRSGKKNRGRLDIVKDMLSVAFVKVKKTRIMYQANLSYYQLEKYLKNLLDSGLIECHDDSCYLITGRGKEFLQTYADHLELCRRVGDQVKGVRKDRLLLEDLCFNNGSNSKRVLNRKEVLA